MLSFYFAFIGVICMNGMGGGGVGGVSGGAAGSFDLAGGHCSGVAEFLIIPIFTGVLQKK